MYLTHKEVERYSNIQGVHLFHFISLEMSVYKTLMEYQCAKKIQATALIYNFLYSFTHKPKEKLALRKKC